jgi:hypothetical protein
MRIGIHVSMFSDGMGVEALVEAVLEVLVRIPETIKGTEPGVIVQSNETLGHSHRASLGTLLSVVG